MKRPVDDSHYFHKRSLCRHTPQIMIAILFALIFSTSVGENVAKSSDVPYQLSERNQEAPFCYRAGSRRKWPIASGKKVPGDTFSLTLKKDDKVLTQGEKLEWEGISISVSARGWLVVESSTVTDNLNCSLEIQHKSPNGKTQTQTLNVRPAPPARPLTYLADFGDDVLYIFGGGKNHYRPIKKDAFDQYFRRLQAHGIERLIVWMSSFPYIADPANYSPEDWSRYREQTLAILQSEELDKGIKARAGFMPWGFFKQLIALRLMPEFGRMISESARQHGIRLTASFRPFEAALTKYSSIPAFDSQGAFLWNFHPMSSPAVNYHPDKIGFAHYREILRTLNQADKAELTTIDFAGVEGEVATTMMESSQGGRGGDLSVIAAPFPPLASETFVLVRQSGGKFELKRWREISDMALSKLPQLSGFHFEKRAGTLRLAGLSVARGTPYLWISQKKISPVALTLSIDRPVELRSAAGNQLGGENVYFAVDEVAGKPEMTRVHGITPSGSYRTEFQATEESMKTLSEAGERIPLKGRKLVISLGADYSVEMMDFTQPAARQFAIKQLKTMLAYPAFDEIIINTRSHTQLAGYLADNVKSIQSISALRRAKATGFHQIGLDEAYVPRDAIEDARIKRLAGDLAGVERLTMPQPGEWYARTCEQAEPYVWRYTRNRIVASGVRQLLLDLQSEFPDTRIRAMIPPSAACVARVEQNLERMLDDKGVPFGRHFYPRLRCGNNLIYNIGEGMAMLDLSGTSIEPVFLGTGGTRQESSSFQMFVRECIADLQGNRGSSFRGPRSYFFEGQFGLRDKDQAAARQNREDVVSHLLAQEGEINDVIFYEAVDWLYKLPLSDSDLSGHGFLDRDTSKRK